MVYPRRRARGDQLFLERPLDRLLVGNIVVVMVMIVVAVVGMHNYHDLRLRRVRNREAEYENQSEQNLFHTSVFRV